MEMLVLNENELLDINGGYRPKDLKEDYDALRGLAKEFKEDYHKIKQFAKGFRDGITGH